MTLCQATSYVLWEALNKLVFEGRLISCGETLQRAATLAVVSFEVDVVNRSGIGLSACWARPVEDVVKVNFHTSFRRDFQAGVGLVARDHEG